MSETPRSWNNWFAAGFRNFAAIERKWVGQQLEAFAGLIGEETGKADAKLYAEIKKLRDEIGQLRDEITLLHAHKAPPDVSLKDVVTPLRSAR